MGLYKLGVIDLLHLMDLSWPAISQHAGGAKDSSPDVPITRCTRGVLVFLRLLLEQVRVDICFILALFEALSSLIAWLPGSNLGQVCLKTWKRDTCQLKIQSFPCQGELKGAPLAVMFRLDALSQTCCFHSPMIVYKLVSSVKGIDRQPYARRYRLESW